jgi:hypothetical protein
MTPDKSDVLYRTLGLMSSFTRKKSTGSAPRVSWNGS